MKKKIPKVYKNPIGHPINNNASVYHVSNTEKRYNDKISIDNINTKIREIFNNTDYIYKTDLEIKFHDSTVIKRIIGRNKDTLISIDNELISINDIEDIKKVS